MLKRILIATLLLSGIVIGGVWWSQPRSHAQPIFTGNAVVDFTGPSVIRIPDDPADPDVGMPRQLPYTDSGWDVQTVYLEYVSLSDTLYVGIDCFAICGDADGDGDPGAASRELQRLGGTDSPDFAGQEWIFLLFDTNNDVADQAAGSQGNGTFDVAVGIKPDSDLAEIGAYTWSGSVFVPQLGFGARLPNGVNAFASPSAAAPDLEFSIGDFSTLPGFPATSNGTLAFRVYVVAGAGQQDAGIGEDFLPEPGSAIPVCVGSACPTPTPSPVPCTGENCPTATPEGPDAATVTPEQPAEPTLTPCTGEGCPTATPEGSDAPTGTPEQPAGPTATPCTGEGCPTATPEQPDAATVTPEQPAGPTATPCTGEGCPTVTPEQPDVPTATPEQPAGPTPTPCTGEGCPTATPEQPDVLTATPTVTPIQPVVPTATPMPSTVCTTGIFGRIVDVVGAGLPNWVVSLQPVDGTQAVAQVMTDGTGTFVVDGLSAGRWVITYALQDGWAAAGAATVELLVEDGAGCAGVIFTVQQQHTAEPITPTRIPGCLVTYRQYDFAGGNQVQGLAEWTVRVHPLGSETPSYTATADTTGYAKFPNLAPGEWVLAQELQSGDHCLPNAEVQLTVPPGPLCVQLYLGCVPPATPTPTPRPTVAPPTGCVSGQVIDDAHVGLAGWQILAKPVAAAEPLLTATSDGSGTFHLRGLQPGRWVIWETVPNGWQGVTVTAFEVTVPADPACVNVRFKNRQD
ncbi:MAG: hypothetical protein KDE19_04565 [Caldilineaceae bacterium]|nr:hypothetical protein [Caldilineaceae bacterium]